MSCHDAREWLSDLVDDALDAEARGLVEAHLAGCADCRRELDRLRATVSLLRAVERPRAPAGFVDRVIEAAGPVPWYRRLLDRLAAVRLLRFPVEAAAVVLVASLAVYVFQETPALRQAARPETARDLPADRSVSTEPRTPAPETGSDQTMETAEVRSKPLRLPSPAPTTAPPTPPAPAPELQLNEPPMNMPAPAGKLAAAAPGAASGPEGGAPTPGVASGQVAPSGPVDGGLRASRKDEASSEGGAAGRAPGASQSMPPESVSPRALRDRMAREADQERTERPAPVPLPGPTAPSAMRIPPLAHVVGRLAVKDRQAADRELAALLSRVGGAETARRAEGGGDTVGLVVPGAAYPAFAQGLARIGVWLPETEPSELPDRVPITLRITQ